MTASHEYLSTGCFHGRHEYCNSMMGAQGAKRPAQCKFCQARCSCSCHLPNVAQVGPLHDPVRDPLEQ